MMRSEFLVKRASCDQSALPVAAQKLSQRIRSDRGGNTSALQTVQKAAAQLEQAAEANAAQARLMKRTISTFIGTEGWEQLLAWMGGDEGPIAPEENIRILGEVFATFLNMLARHATSEQLMACGLAYSERADQVQALNRAQRRAKAKRKKKGGK